MHKGIPVYSTIVNHMVEHIPLGDIIRDARAPRGLSKGYYGKSLSKGRKSRRR